jgi:ABC-type bacteriocin/lantibiotic exporter with double-glycine peptidase domain
MIKIQDLTFILLFLFVLWRRSSKLAVGVGLFCLLLAIPLFKFWIFFTGERLTWYAAAFFFCGILFQLIKVAK